MQKSLIKKTLDKHTKSSRFRFSFLVSRFSFLAIFVFLITISANSQIKIKDRVEISPEGLNITASDGSITGNNINAVYLGYGGEVKIRLIHLTNFGLQLWEETLGKLQITGEEISLGTFPQWHKFVFYLLDPSTDQRYYPEHNDDIVWEMGSTIDFYPTHQPGEPYPWNPEDWWEINLDVDYSLAKMPPSEILSYLGNPFVASESFEMPITGSLYAIVYSHTNSNDALWMDLPDTQLLQSDVANHTAEVIEIGSFQAGEMIRFFITSSNSVVSGISLYPRSEYVEEPDNEGNIHLWSLYFEDWTDLMFDDLEVEIYIRPEGDYQGNVAVIITPEQLAPGDTASITFKRRFLNGSLEDFSEEQRFEVGMLEGCDAGQILVGGVLAPYFEEVNQPIYFVAASDLTETDTVKVRVGLIESGASRPMQKNDKDREIITLRKNKTTQQKPLGENTATYCFIGEIDWPKMGDGFVVVGDECDEKIVVCNNYQIPKFEDVSTIYVLGENDPWQWIDDQGSNQTTNAGTACDYQVTSGCDDILFGQTYIMPKIGDFAIGSPPPPIYNRLDDLQIVVCLDENNPNHQYWNFNVENLRVPIFSSHCPDQPQICNYVDLGDGTNSALLAQHIKNCTDYNKVMNTIFYWIIGPERMGMKPFYKYYFSTGIIAHENHHLGQIRKYLPLILNGAGGLKQLRNKKIEMDNIIKCPEDALNVKKQEIIDQFNDLLYMINDLKTLMNKDKNGKYISEIDADKASSQTYETIGQNILSWASQQSWWCDLRIIGLYGPPNYYDCKLVPCNP